MADRNAIPRTPQPDARPGWKLRIEERFGLLDPIQIVVFRSFGTPDLLHLRGRVRERKGVEGTSQESSVWQNVVNSLHRLESDEIPGARLRAHFAGRTWDATTDTEGYFVLNLDLPEPLPPGWHDVRLELVESVGTAAERFVVEPVLVPAPDAEFAIISDVDDTVVRSRSADFFRMLAIVFSQGAHDRVVVPGIPAFYRALERGPDGRGRNPVFYVSMSGWNLYDLFTEFMDLNDIPRGPLFLSDLRFLEEKSAVMASGRHKYDSIDLLLRTYPELPFVLIGDSGMRDPELYREVVRSHPGRIRAIYIHDVSESGRDEEVQRIAAELEREGVPMMRAEDLTRAAEHAAGHGLIRAAEVDEVRREVERQTHSGKDPD
jgi:phosphatidate phosphatase APP1